MFADIDHSHPAVCEDILKWGTWISSTLNLGGMRFDAIKHYSLSFLTDFTSRLGKTSSRGKEMFFVGEYWDADSDSLWKVVEKLHGRLNLFDVQLVYTLSAFSRGRRWDLRTTFDGSLVQRNPTNAVTFIANHDTQET
jgi:alpha-amylase